MTTTKLWIIRPYAPGDEERVTQLFESVFGSESPVRGAGSIAGKTVDLPNGTVTAESAQGSGMQVTDFSRLSIRLRQGGEKIRFSRNKSLKNLMQEKKIPAFLRDFMPLIYMDDQLVAMGGVPDWNIAFIVCPGFEVEAPESGWLFNWHF